jgi:hypothetical protein
MRRRRKVALGIVGAWAAALGWNEIARELTALAPAPPERCADAGALDASLLLVGDAGAPRADEPLLVALRDEAAERVRAQGSERVAIAFLGDNVYPEGLRDAAHPARAEDERRLVAQLDVVRGAGARGFFVPGNHDWSNGYAAGWDAVKRQTRFVAARGARVVPPDGCAGPVALPLGDALAMVFLDTQWWLQRGPRPEGDASPCATADVGAVETALAAALADAAPRHAIVMAHHPLATGGPHGALFGWKEHLFPLREIAHAAWVPLPVVGSVWPLLRIWGAGDQDVTSRAYLAMEASIRRGLAAAPPLVFAAGHDHNLQLIRGDGPRFHVVSGAGTAANLTWAHRMPGTLYAAATPGWARLDAYAGGAVELVLRALAADGTPRDAHRACLTAREESARGTRRP